VYAEYFLETATYNMSPQNVDNQNTFLQHKGIYCVFLQNSVSQGTFHKIRYPKYILAKYVYAEYFLEIATYSMSPQNVDNQNTFLQHTDIYCVFLQNSVSQGYIPQNIRTHFSDIIVR
jgi:ABC-type Zn uptake system ZnuABC Zn-binding protein ZnuA